MPIETFSDVTSWFRERLVSCLGARRLELEAETEFYLVELLASAAGRRGGAETVGQRALAAMLLEASEAEDGAERLRLYRSLGDEALYVGGFFVEHLERRGVSERYVHELGARGYEAAASLAERTQAESPRAAVYRELAIHFEPVARVLDDVRESTAMRTPQDIVRLYDQWRRTGSPRVAMRLSEEGVFPTIGGKTVH